VARAAEILRTDGVRVLWFKILGETVYHRILLTERRLDEPIPEVRSAFPIVIGFLGPGDIDAYLLFRSDATRAEVHRRLDSDHRCVVVWYEGRIVHAAWLMFGCAWIEAVNVEIPLAPDAAYAYESYSAPDLRRGDLAASRLAWMMRYLRDTGYRRALGTVVPENRPGLRTLEKMGYRVVGMAGCFWLGPWRRTFWRLHPAGESSDEGPAYWDQVLTRVERSGHYLDRFLGEMKRQAHLALVRRWGGLPASGRILKTDLFEEATGHDAFLADLAGRGAPAVGIDLSPAVVSRARARQGDAHRYVVSDVRRLPFAPGSFSLIVSPSTLDHFADPGDLGRALRELVRVLAPGGRLIVTLDNRQNVFDPILRLVTRLGMTPYRLGRSYSIAELTAELERAGVRVDGTTAILHNPRLLAVAGVRLTRGLGWLGRLVQRGLQGAQRLEGTRWQYRTGSFVAASGVRSAGPDELEAKARRHD
jgi:SAM-dependent methyltransferase